MAIDAGEAITRRIYITRADGSAVDADSTPTYALTLPDGSTASPPAVQHGATGEYYVNVTTTSQIGLYADVWTASVLTLPTKFGPDSFRVRAATLPPLIGLADARTTLGIGSDASRDERIREYLEAATSLCEDHCGIKLRRQTVVEVHDGGEPYVFLQSMPVQSVATVTENGTVVAASGWVLDAQCGLLWRGSTTGRSYWAPGAQNVSVTLVAGAADPPVQAVQAVRLTLSHLWATQRGATGAPRRTGAAGEDYAAGGTGWSLPRAAAELLEGLREMWGV